MSVLSSRNPEDDNKEVREMGATPTPGPWIAIGHTISADQVYLAEIRGEIASHEENVANAQLIVTAVNAHERLMKLAGKVAAHIAVADAMRDAAFNGAKAVESTAYEETWDEMYDAWTDVAAAIEERDATPVPGGSPEDEGDG